MHIDLFDLLCFNATLSNISAMSWRLVSAMEEAGVPGETYRPWASNSKTISLGTESQVQSCSNLQSWAQTHAVLVIGLNELLGNPAT
jgi:hypothetical protein